MPSAILSIDLAADGSATIAPWTVAWGQEDIDGDGNPARPSPWAGRSVR